MDSPFLKKAKKKSSLRIIQTEDDDELSAPGSPAGSMGGGGAMSDADSSFQDSPSSAIAAAKAKAKAGKKKKAPVAKLSFGGADDEDVSVELTRFPSFLVRSAPD